MPGVIPVTPEQLRTGAGWRDLLVADAGTSGEPMALQVHRLELAAGARSEPQTVGANEGFMYVVSGDGRAVAARDTFVLAPESVLWLDPGDPAVVFEAGATGLTVLLATAPGG